MKRHMVSSSTPPRVTTRTEKNKEDESTDFKSRVSQDFVEAKVKVKRQLFPSIPFSFADTYVRRTGYVCCGEVRRGGGGGDGEN